MLGVYRDADGGLHEVYASASTPARTWGYTNLTAKIPGLPAAASDPVGLVMSVPGGFGVTAGPYVDQQHVFFLDQGGKIQHCSAYWGGSWTLNTDLMTATAAPSSATGEISAYAYNPYSGSEDSLHVWYRDIYNHLNEMAWNAFVDPVNSWSHFDQTQNSGAVPTWDEGDPAGYVFQIEGTQHVAYRGQDQKIHELFWTYDTNKGYYHWFYNPMTNQVPDLPDATGNPAAYTWETQGTEHIVFCGPDLNIYELYYNAS